MCILCELFKYDSSITLGDIVAALVTLLGFIIAISQYTTQMKASRSSALKLQKENWYLNIIVLPQINNVNSNYLELISLLETKVDLCESMKAMSHNAFLKETGRIKREVKDKINNDFDHFIVLVRSYDKNLGTEVNNIILSLSDIATEVLDKYDQKIDIRTKVLDNKEKFIYQLNTGLSIN